MASTAKCSEEQPKIQQRRPPIIKLVVLKSKYSIRYKKKNKVQIQLKTNGIIILMECGV